MRVHIVDYGAGNLNSLRKALDYLGAPYSCSSLRSELESCTHILLPGVGAFDFAMLQLQELGLDKVLCEQALEVRKPFLGVCLGMQLLFQESEETTQRDNVKGLGIFRGKVTWLGKEVKRVPHIGWNEVWGTAHNPLFSGIPEGNDFYFAHSYCAVPEEELLCSSTEHGISFVSALAKENIFAVQFHPEKSQKVGLELLHNFIRFSYA